MNDAAPPMLDAVDARPGGLKGLVTAIGGFSRFDSLDVGTPTPGDKGYVWMGDAEDAGPLRIKYYLAGGGGVRNVFSSGKSPFKPI